MARRPRSTKRVETVANATTTPLHTAGTLGEWLDYLMPDASDRDWVPMWPPDAFAIGAALLRRTGGYLDLVNGDDLRSSVRVLDADVVSAAGRAWRRDLNEIFATGLSRTRSRKQRKRIRDVCPSQIRGAWAVLRANGAIALADIRSHRDVTAAAINLCTVSDAACEGLGVGVESQSSYRKDVGEDNGASPFLGFAERNAAREPNRFRSYCLHIPPAKLAVLGKRHTPQRGCSVRSLTHHLALYTPTEIQAVWPAPIQKTHEEIDVFNVLMLPWPVDIADVDFGVRVAVGHQRYFDYTPRPLSSPTALLRVKRAMAEAAKYVDRVHAVVLPELALDESEFAAVEKFVSRQRAMLVSGVRKAACAETCGMPANTCAIQPYGLSVHSDINPAPNAEDLDAHRRTQFKHHRWCLDRRQIMQYNLGGRLPASRDCWEYTYLGQREIHFVTLASWLTISTLICEDLARQEPVTEVVRAVGPNLIFALLMDGPQLKSRWSSRYASVLAEDPGCSVLSVTSLGMSKRSRPAGVDADDDKSNCIALWRDAVYGEQELALGPDHDAGVLSLVCKSKEEFTVAGHNLSRRAHFPVYAGYQSFRSQAAPRRKAVQ